MVEILTEENRVLHQELQGYYDNADKLHKVCDFPRAGEGRPSGGDRILYLFVGGRESLIHSPTVSKTPFCARYCARLQGDKSHSDTVPALQGLTSTAEYDLC